MKNRPPPTFIDRVIVGFEVILVAGTLALPFATGAILWNGPAFKFANLAVSDQDHTGLDVWTESSLQHFFSPADTGWNPLAGIAHGGLPKMAGVNAAMHLVSEDNYLDAQISWPTDGGFSYVRSTPSKAFVPPALTATPATGD